MAWESVGFHNPRTVTLRYAQCGTAVLTGISRINRTIIIRHPLVREGQSGHVKDNDHHILNGYLIGEREKSESTKRMSGTSKEATHWVT